MVKKIIFLAFTCFLFGNSNAQSLIDLSVGTTLQDNFAMQIVFKNHFSKKFRAGIEFQYGLVRERYIEAKPINEGYSNIVALPMTLLLNDNGKAQLFGTLKVGVRFQGIIDPDDNDIKDHTLSSTALLGEFGLYANVKASHNLFIQGGVSFPVGYELSPSSLFEYQWTNINLGASYNIQNCALFLKGNFGPSFGASGDTYKFMWGVQTGIRFKLGNRENRLANFIETTF